MRRLALLVLVIVPLAAAAAPAGARTACTPGTKTVNGATERTFCGAAKATVHAGSKTFSFSGGQCTKAPAYVTVNIGTVVLGMTSKPKPDYFGLDVGKLPGGGGTPASHDGTNTSVVLAIDSGGKGYVVTGARVTLKGNRTRGTFTGTMLGGPGGTVTGSFSC